MRVCLLLNKKLGYLELKSWRKLQILSPLKRLRNNFWKTILCYVSGLHLLMPSLTCISLIFWTSAVASPLGHLTTAQVQVPITCHCLQESLPALWGPCQVLLSLFPNTELGLLSPRPSSALWLFFSKTVVQAEMWHHLLACTLILGWAWTSLAGNLYSKVLFRQYLWMLDTTGDLRTFDMRSNKRFIMLQACLKAGGFIVQFIVLFRRYCFSTRIQFCSAETQFIFSMSWLLALIPTHQDFHRLTLRIFFSVSSSLLKLWPLPQERTRLRYEKIKCGLIKLFVFSSPNCYTIKQCIFRGELVNCC